MRTERNGIGESVETAQDAAIETAQMLKNVAVDAGAKAQELATATGRQASAAAQTAYNTGNDMLGQIESAARENIGLALLIAGFVGYGLACLVKSARS
jgi:hypothetical protein